jgi:hypothetical protein
MGNLWAIIAPLFGNGKGSCRHGKMLNNFNEFWILNAQAGFFEPYRFLVGAGT